MQSKEYKTAIDTLKNDLQKDILEIKISYDSLFDFDNMFYAQSMSKNKLNRVYFKDCGVKIEKNISSLLNNCNIFLFFIIQSINQCLHNKQLNFPILEMNVHPENYFDDATLFEFLLKNNEKEYLLKFQELIYLKNSILNVKYLVHTLEINGLLVYLNQLNPEDLQNNKIILDILDSFALKAKEINKIQDRLKHFTIKNNGFLSEINLRNLITLYATNISSFHETKSLHNISLNFDIQLKKNIPCDYIFLENIISYLIEHCCIDLMQKIQNAEKTIKIIDIHIYKRRKNIYITFFNNGRTVEDINELYTNKTINKYIIQVKNIANMMKASFKIQAVKKKGMSYTLIVKA